LDAFERLHHEVGAGAAAFLGGSESAEEHDNKGK
jgi:hypothetical protein